MQSNAWRKISLSLSYMEFVDCILLTVKLSNSIYDKEIEILFQVLYCIYLLFFPKVIYFTANIIINATYKKLLKLLHKYTHTYTHLHEFGKKE